MGALPGEDDASPGQEGRLAARRGMPRRRPAIAPVTLEAVPQETLELIRRANALANAGGWDALAELWHPDAEWRDLAHAPDSPETVHGRDAIRAIWAQWEVLELAAEVREYVDADPWAVCDVRWRARGRGSEVSV